MSTEYYSLEKVSEVLGLPTAEVNRLRERNQLRAFRDGNSWKFKKDEVDNHLAETIKSRGKQKGADSDFDLLNSEEEDEAPTLLADSASFDTLMEDGSMFGDAMVDTTKRSSNGERKSGISFQKGTSGKSTASDDLMLVDEPGAEVDLSLGDDEVVLDGTGSSSKLNLAEDSGLSLLAAADEVELQSVEKGGSDGQFDDDDDILSLVEAEGGIESTTTVAIPIEDEFQLTPSADVQADDSESSSQVIALEEENMFGSPIGMEPSLGFDAAAAPTAAGPQAGPFGAGPGPSGEFVAQTPAFASSTVAEPSYNTLAIVGLVCCAFALVLCGCISLDLIFHIWSWEEPFVINSTIMDLVAGVAGLK